ncbi:MAG: FG-GAP-like repeat-containing protein [Desulfobacterales bacterium]|jgi:murein DD-endopeptidase MepM/ murein hydrolase activator NlpD
MKRFSLAIMISMCVAIITPAAVLAAAFSYLPPGDLAPGSGTGRVDYKVYLPGMRFPVEKAPAYANSQVWGVGGMNGPGGSQCDADNYSYPWRDNYCEKRSWTMPMCPSGTGHQGQDIRPATCADSVYWTVAAEGGTITSIGSYTVYLQGDSGVRHRYLHLNHSTLTVWKGKRVEKGDKIGKISDNMGNTPTTIHLHYDMHSGGVYIPPYMSLVSSYQTLLGIGDAVKRSVAADGADFDGDNRDDVFWYAAGSASDAIWYGTGRNRWSKYSGMNIYGTYVPIAGDFDGDGNSDIFWYAAGDAADWIYYGEGRSGKFRVVRKTVKGTYTPISGDFNGDGRTDIFWYGPGTSNDSIWMATTTGFKYYPAAIWGTYKPIAGDFDGDGKDDIFWYAAGDAADWIYYGTADPANKGFRVVQKKVMGTYTPISGDFNGDGRHDILWYGPGDNFDALWMAQGSGFKYYAIKVLGIYRPVKGDFDGDGICDIFWYGVGGGVDNMWFGNPDHTFKWMAANAVNGVYIPIP